jgi:uncharacterized protein (TIGR02246 family)
MRYISTSIVVFALLVMAFGNPARAAAGDQEAAIKARVAEFVTAWSHHDAKQMAMFWTEDGDLINPFGRVAKGRAEVQQLFADEQSGPMKTSTMDMQVESVRMAGELALADCRCNITGIRDRDGKEQPPLKLHVFFVMTQKDGKWMYLSARPYAYVAAPDAPK